MPLLTKPSDYTYGLITLTNGLADFTGSGTAWQLIGLAEGDLLIDVDGATEFWAIIAEITSNTTGTLTRPWAGPDLVDAEYRMRFTSDGTRSTAQAAMLRQDLGNGRVQAIANATGASGVLEYLPGGGARLVPKSELVSGADYDVQVADIAARAAYDGQTEGYAVLVADTGDGRAAIYSKASASSGDWSDPAYVTGETGSKGDTGDTGPAGPGFTFVGGGYDGGTAYVIGDVVRDNGSSWIALQPTTGNAPPVFPITANDWWELVAAKGQDGTGTGDVVGPSGAVADRIATFDGTTGKLLKDGGKTIADLVPAAGSITNSILAPMATATIKGRIAAGAGAPSDLTAAQVLSLISAVRPCFRADKNGTDQTGVGNAPITFTHEVFDVGGYYDAANSRWTPPVGKVRLHTRVLIAGAVADQAAYVVSFTKNGIIVSSSVIRASGSASMSVDLSEIVETNGTDYWGVNLSSAGASVTASGPVEYTTFSGEML